jgi:7-carboxy-7-deazaguanine synthase
VLNTDTASQGRLLRLAEAPYLSIEGEGIHIGKPMTFIRLAECNLRCKWCDTKFSWSKGVEWRHKAILDRLEKIRCVNVSLTGGEPLLQASELIMLLNQLTDYITYLNTSGTVWSTLVFDKVNWISCDLKMPSSQMKSDPTVVHRLAETYPEKLQFKIVVSHEDLPYLLKTVKEIPMTIPVTIQPEYNSYGTSGAVYLSEWVKTHLQNHVNIRVLPQLHRLIWPNRERGV